jgi:hypothetical protein
MKNFNLSLITLIYGSFLFIHNSCHANTTLLIVEQPYFLIQTKLQDSIDPDWDKLITHLINLITVDDSKD